ncbi:MAG: PAS domain-containing protein [Methylobacteriaceae bacterium]|nr:PAS domain-containing protein [Methylobacteriaceae bacterium]
MDIWPLIERALGGEATWSENLPLVLQRNGYPEEAAYTFSYSPVRGDDGAIAGMFCACTETTDKLRADRLAAFRLAVEEALRGLADPADRATAAAATLGREVGVDRAGFAEVIGSGEAVSIPRDWTRDVSVRSLTGETKVLDAFGPDLIRDLRAGDTVAVEDCTRDPRTSDPRYGPSWAEVQCRALLAVPYRQDGVLRAILYLHDAAPRRWTAIDRLLAEDAAQRSWDVLVRARAETALRESEARFRHMADSAPALIGMTDESGRLSFVNMHFGHMFGAHTADLLAGWKRLIHPDDLPGYQAGFRAAFAGREPFTAEVRVLDGKGETRWIRTECVARTDDVGQFLGYTGCGLEITDVKRAEAHQRLLIHELNHRVKNTLATVQSIVAQTLRNAVTPVEAQAAVEARLLALSRVQDVLTQESWEGADLRIVVDRALDPFRGGDDAGRLFAQGPDVRLPPRTALALAMALQELATNAAKYGALSVPDGTIRIAWTMEPAGAGGRLKLVWTESGGPPVSAPTRRGFGSRLIERSLASELDGQAAIAFEPTGVVCRLEAPLG